MEAPRRLTPTADTIRLLLLRSGNRCFFPGCSHPIFNDDNILVAECCHIEAAMPGGERFNPQSTNEDRRSYDNLLFLCKEHHVVTNDFEIYSVKKLQKIKTEHEQKYREQQIVVNSKFIQQVEQTFNDIVKTINSSHATIKKIEVQQEKLIDLLNISQHKANTEGSKLEYINSDPPYPHYFQGRKRELAKIKSAHADYNMIQVGGASGIGKTYFISYFLASNPEIKALWIDCETINTVENFYVVLGQFLNNKFGDNISSNLLFQSNQSNISQQIHQVLDRNQLTIVFDGLNTKEHELYSLLELLNLNLKLSKVIFSTTTDISSINWSNPVYKISLSGLDKETLNSIITHYQVKNIQPKAKEELFQLIGGHPFLLKLVISIIEHYPLENFLYEFHNTQFDEITEYIKLKYINTLSKDESKFLAYVISLGIPFRIAFVKLLPVNESTEVLRSLLYKFLLERKETTWYSVPQFVQNFFPIELNEVIIDDSVELFFEYLRLISPRTIFEQHKLINCALDLGQLNFAKSESKRLLTATMFEGQFNLTLRLADEMSNDDRTKHWDFIYYVQGRVYRFMEDYNSALTCYENGIKYSDDGMRETLKFEKASILTYLYEVSGDNSYHNQAKLIYNNLSLSDSKEMVLRSKSTLIGELIKHGQVSKGIKELNAILKSIDDNIDKSILAGVWHMLGNAYTKQKKYQKAIDCFEESFSLYEGVIQRHGMNSIEGLYHLYENLGTSYSKASLHTDSAQMFLIASNLCNQFNLMNRHEKSLHKAGYEFIIAGEMEKACDILSEHYDLILKNELFNEVDMRLIYASLSFCHWYAGKVLDAVQLLGLYIIECYRNNSQPMIVFMEATQETHEFDPIKWFLKRALTFILPEDKSFEDLRNIVSTVSELKPELKDIFAQLHFYQKPSASDT